MTALVHKEEQPVGVRCRCRWCEEAIQSGKCSETELVPTRRHRKGIRHGVYTSYTNRKCRCPSCREAHRRYHMGWRETARKALRQGKVLRRARARGEAVIPCPLCGELTGGERGLRVHKGLRHRATASVSHSAADDKGGDK